jgi:hypothetical protein
VHDDHVPLVGVLQLVGVQPVVTHEHVLLVLRQRLRVALQAVVDRLGDVEELVAAVDHAPLGLDADVVQQRDQGVLDLGDAAAEGGGRQVQHALAAQRLGQRADLLGQRPAHDRRVVGKGLVAHVDALHGRAHYQPPSTSDAPFRTAL